MAVLDERTCRPGVKLNKMLTASEAFLIKRFLNNFRVRMYNGSEPFVDRSSEYGDWVIWIPEGGGGGGGTSLRNVDFWYRLVFDADTLTTSCTINPGYINVHGQARYELPEEPEENREVELTGETAIVWLEYQRAIDGENYPTITLRTGPVLPPIDGPVVSVPLFTFKGTEVEVDESTSYLSYRIHRQHRIGGLDVDTPIVR
jgi:hypothetical protein